MHLSSQVSARLYVSSCLVDAKGRKQVKEIAQYMLWKWKAWEPCLVPKHQDQQQA